MGESRIKIQCLFKEGIIARHPASPLDVVVLPCKLTSVEWSQSRRGNHSTALQVQFKRIYGLNKTALTSTKNLIRASSHDDRWLITVFEMGKFVLLKVATYDTSKDGSSVIENMISRL